MKDMHKYRIIAHVKTARCYIICDFYLYAKKWHGRYIYCEGRI